MASNFGTYQGHVLLAEGFKNMGDSISTAIENKRNRAHDLEKQKGTGANRAIDLSQQVNEERNLLLNEAYKNLGSSELFKDGKLDDEVAGQISTNLQTNIINDYLENNPNTKLSFEDLETVEATLHNKLQQQIARWQVRNTGEGQRWADGDEFLEFAKGHPEFNAIIKELGFTTKGVTPGDTSVDDPDVTSLEADNPLYVDKDDSRWDAENVKDVSTKQWIDAQKTIRNKVNSNFNLTGGVMQNDMEASDLDFEEKDGKLWVIDNDTFTHNDVHEVRGVDTDKPYIVHSKSGKKYYLNELGEDAIESLFE